ncbi:MULTISPECIES: MFS transporter [unclassified Duganella]|uniref:MFS transporter n=1 Tax=unclassified Duganella TaxID=2636909 RepID=UPI000E34D763|nr:MULTISPECIES: MFS transporter [unclassified Duganella]RFP18715.1 MFS transporter [Duganella sp. BJB475]RFP35380.1 MFS transporter [Duganella sp. BJB476]
MIKQLMEAARHMRGGWISLCALLLLGDLGWSLKERAVQELFKAQLMLFSQNAILLNVLLGALPALAALTISPAIGAWSDRSATRWGRRIPFLLPTSLLTACAMLGLAYSEAAGRALAGSAEPTRWIVVAMVVCWSVFDVATCVGNTLFLALINDTVPRHILGRFCALFRIVSLATGAAFFACFFDNSLTSWFRPLLIGLAAAYLAAMLAVCLGVREPAPGARAPAAAAGPAGELALLFAAVALAAIAVLPLNINSYNARAQFGVDAASFGRAIALTYGISIVLAWPLGWLADRFHPLRVGGAVLALYALAMLGAWAGVAGRSSFLVALVLHGVLAGAFLTGTAALLPAMLPQARFSQLAALSAAVTALLAVVSTVAMGAALDGAGHDYRLLFLVEAGVAGLGVLLWWRLLRRHAAARLARGRAWVQS